ncbi:hypothetical protein ACFS2C_07300 [Prauserella oleivorans]|uniref:DUF7144 domain-containing protein n=1 Tax=Prauserella oleivorans TaxID=1478153 RepID=A0ABW5W7W5_9PSEU
MAETHAQSSGAWTTARGRPTSAATPWAGWITFGAVMMALLGFFNVIFGLIALFEDTYYAITPQGLLLFDLTTWGWIHLLVGAAAVLAGFALMSGATWARAAAVILASFNAVAHLAFLPAYPIWSVIAIALDVLVIWAVVVHGGEYADRERVR